MDRRVGHHDQELQWYCAGGPLASVEEWTRRQLAALIPSSSPSPSPSPPSPSTWDAATAAIDYLTGNAGLVQERVLASILSRNAPSLYLSQFGFTVPDNTEHNNGVNPQKNPHVSGDSPHDDIHSTNHVNNRECYSAQKNLHVDANDGSAQRRHEEIDAADDSNNFEAIAAMVTRFRKLVPVIAYQEIEPFIRRIAQSGSDASAPILCTQPVTEFFLSSGTTAAGVSKLLPAISEDGDRRHFAQRLGNVFLNHYFPDIQGKLGLFFLISKPGFHTPAGLSAKALSTRFFESQQFKDIAPSLFVSPAETILCKDVRQSLYCQLLCGLVRYREVYKMGSVFATAFLRAIKLLQDEWQSLCRDIQSGANVINSMIATMPDVMELLSSLTPAQSASLVDRITAECSKDSWHGILTRLWPNAAFIQAVVTGTMSQYIPVLDYYSGGLPLVSTMYASSECFIGLNIQPGLTKPSDISYTILPNMAYFEFIPLDQSRVTDPSNPHAFKEEEAAVTLTDVEIGKEYELLATTYAGLYRYKIGDVLRVTGFHNYCPQVQIVGRKNAILSVDQEKTDEGCLHKAVTASSDKLQSEAGIKLAEYTSYCDLGTIPGHYVILWELLKPSFVDLPLLESCCLCIEESLDSRYRQCRAYEHTIGPLEIRIVQCGTFDMLMDYLVTRGSATISQYKTPRCIKSSEQLELLACRVTQRASSPRSPSWVPHHGQ